MTLGRLDGERARSLRRPGAGRWLRRIVPCLVLSLLVLGAPAAAQVANGDGGEEIRMLREAQAREEAGDLGGAEQILRGILDRRPGALSALLGFERVLRMQGRVAEILPYVERLLARDPQSAIGHQMVLRTFSSLDRVEAMERAADAWIRATPGLETPYRETARVWRGRGEPERAIAVLERGRDRLGGSALALELGSLYAERDELDRAAREWYRAIGRDARGLHRVRRRLVALPDGGARLTPRLIDRLLASNASLAQRRAAAELAIDAGLAGRAERIARGVADDLEGAGLESFLVEVARRADSVRLRRLAYWAYGRLLDVGGPEDRQLAIRSRVAELALAVGDTTSARRHYAVIEESYAEGSPARRKAAAVRIQLTVREGGLEEALGTLAGFRSRYPEAPELDELSATVAEAVLRGGDEERADRILTGVRGPQSGMLRSQIALERGDIEDARIALLAAAPELEGADATDAITLATLLDRLSAESAALIGRALGRAARGAPQDAVALLLAESSGLADEEGAAVLDFAAGLADRAGLEPQAERVRRTIINRYPHATESPQALLALARSLAGRPGGMQEARELLMRLVLEHPRSALVPQARRELNRLDRRVPNS